MCYKQKHKSSEKLNYKEDNYMKNKLRRIVGVLLTGAVLLSVAAGCSSKDPPQTGDLPHGEWVRKRAGELAVTGLALNNGGNFNWSDVFSDGFQVTQQIRWLSWYPLDPNSPTMEMFNARFGGVAGHDSPIEVINVTYENRYDRLGQLIAGGDSPDMFQFEERWFPWGVHQSQFEAVCSFIDFSRPEWDGTRDVMELFQWGGKNYTAITELTNSTAMLFYRNTIRERAGLEDPQQLWREGRWDWDEFMTMMRQFSEQDTRWGIMGFLIDEAAILSTGVGILTLENGILQSNMDDSRVERAMDMLRSLAQSDFRYPHHILNDHQLRHSEFRNGNVLFVQDGPWRFQELYNRYAADDDWEEDELRIVPFPFDPNNLSGNQYIRGKQDAMMWVQGSLNRDGFLAWTYSALMAHQDAEMQQATRVRDIAVHSWTERNLDVLEEMRDPTRFTFVWDFKNGIGPDISCAVTDSPVENLTKPVIVEGLAFPQQRDAVRMIILDRIGVMNARVQS
jgi:multiple sugar transport system substrate-binding protein